MTTKTASKKFLLIALITALALIGVSLAVAQEANPGNTTSAETPFLGITYDPNPNGLRVATIVPGSPADTAGLQVGDIITKIDNEAVTVRNITSVINGHQVGDTLTVTFTRSGASQDVTATLTARPETTLQNANPPSTLAERPFLGIRLEDSENGVRIAQVVTGSPAETAGLRVGDIVTSVNGASVTAAEDVVKAVAALKPGDQVSLDITRDGADQTIQATLGSAPAIAQAISPFDGRGRGQFNGIAVQYNDSDKSWEIVNLSEDNALYQAGLRAGDKLTEFDGTAYTPSDLQTYLSGLQAGANVSLTVVRDGATQTITAPVEALYGLTSFGFGFFGGQGIPFDMGQHGQLGVQFLELDPQVAQERGLDITDGALITDVMPDSAAATAGLKANDIVTAVDGDKVDSERTLRDRLYAYEPGDTVTLDILRDGQQQQIQVTLDQAKISSDFPFQFFGMPNGQGMPFEMPGMGNMPGPGVRGQMNNGQPDV